MGLAMRLLHGVGTHALGVHGERHQGDTEPGGDALDEGIGQRLDPAAAAGRHHRRQHRGNALTSVGGEGKLLRVGRPAGATHEAGGDIARSLRAAARTLALRHLDRFGALETGEALCNHRRLRRQHRIVDLHVDLHAARLVRQNRDWLLRLS